LYFFRLNILLFPIFVWPGLKSCQAGAERGLTGGGNIPPACNIFCQPLLALWRFFA